MPKGSSSWTQERIGQVRDAFIEEWSANDRLPVSKPELNRIGQKLFGPSAVVYSGMHQTIREAIDVKMKVEHGVLAPVLGAAGALITRDGTTAPRKSGRPPKQPGEPGAVSHRIVWTADEIARLMEAVIELWRIAPADGLTLQLLRAAQEKCIIASRRRQITTYATVDDLMLKLTEEVTRRVELAFVPPPVVEKPVPVPYDVDQVLGSVELPVLAAALTRRTGELEAERHAQLLAALAGRHAAPAEHPAAHLVAGGISKPEDVAASFIKVQLVGFHGHHVTMLRERLKGQPITFVGMIYPGNQVDAALISKTADKIVVNKSDAPTEWRELINERVSADRRILSYNAERARAELHELALAWRQKHPKLIPFLTLNQGAVA